MICILGNGGHAKVCAACYPDDEINFREFDLTRGIVAEDAYYVIGVGDIALRRELFVRFCNIGRGMLGARHYSAVMAEVEYKKPPKRFAGEVFVLGNPCLQIMAGAIIQPGCTIGNNVLINTRVSVDHDCIIGDHVHIAPGAILCGGVTVGEGAFIGAGAIIPEGRNVPAGAFVKAGSVFA